MPTHKRRSAPTYLIRRRGRWHGRFRYVDSLGRVCWPCEVSPNALDYHRSLAWAPAWRVDWIRAHEAELRAAGEERQRPLSVGELFAAYEADCKERGTRWDREASRAKRLLEELGSETPYADLTPNAIAAWRASARERRGLSARTLNAYLTLLQGALNLAVRRGAIAENPIRYLGKLPEAELIPEALSVRQVQALLAALEDLEALAAAGERSRAQAARKPNPTRRSPVPLRGIVLTCYYTMARTGNVLALRWEDVDLERGEIIFRRTKTGRRLVVPIRAALAEHLATTRPGPGATGYLWPSPRTGRPYTDVARPWRELIRLANLRLPEHERIPAGQRLYSLRHSGISHLLLASVPPQVVAQLADNSITVIHRHYAHLHDDALRHAIEIADANPSLAVSKEVSNGGQKTAQLARTDENGAPN
ncbi:MAG: site-specific integrase [Thermoanaerobaculaceae bacterium]